MVLELEVDPAKTTPAARPPRWAAALAGLIAGAVAVTVGSLVAGIIDVRSPIDAVGTQVINHAPVWLIDLGKQLFGTGDKAALRTGIVVILAVVAAILGVVSVRRRWIGVLGMMVFGVFGMICALGLPDEPASTVVPALLGSIVGSVVLVKLVPRPVGPRRTPGASKAPLGWDRRQFLVTSGLVAGGVVIVGGASAAVERKRVDSIRETIPDSLPSACAGGDPRGC